MALKPLNMAVICVTNLFSWQKIGHFISDRIVGNIATFALPCDQHQSTKKMATNPTNSAPFISPLRFCPAIPLSFADRQRVAHHQRSRSISPMWSHRSWLVVPAATSKFERNMRPRGYETNLKPDVFFFFLLSVFAVTILVTNRTHGNRVNSCANVSSAKRCISRANDRRTPIVTMAPSIWATIR